MKDTKSQDRAIPVRRARFRKWALRLAAVLALAIGAFVTWRWSGGNTGVVVPGEVYRSAQLGPRGLHHELASHHVRTVLNLRGTNTDQAWYQTERAATLAAGATQVDVPMASDHWLSREQARTLVELLDECERPILNHCEGGAERTGLASAFAELLRPGGSLEAARGQFSAWYLFAPTHDGLVMRRHIDAYARWLRLWKIGHSPEHFRVWVTLAYRPGYPSRDDWPYDPYPLVVVTRPGGEAVAQRPASDRK
jgi:protein tyrosine phosphatase (PTP) superfamily phosphohydrolase (DUF442 family)